jgi:hypothetical protein
MRREGELLARVKHANVVTIYGADEFDGIVGLWMELIHGRTLEAELTTRGTFSPQEALPLGRELCRALAAVQGAGLLHRDVKAHNVMRETGGRIVLMDFGTGKDVGPGAPAAAKAGGDLAGTPLYLAPELFAGAAATPASDIYSLGVLLFHLVTGKYPVEGANRAEIQAAHALHRRTRLRDARPDLPDGVVQVIERAIAPEAAQRYQTAGAFDEALAGASGTPTPGDASRSHPPGLTSEHGSTWQAGSTWHNGSARQNGSTRPTSWRGAAGWGLATLTVVAIAVLGSLWMMRQAAPGGAAVTPDRTRPLAAGTPVEAPDSSYLVKANFFRRRDDADTLLTFGDQVRPGDTLGLRIQASKPVYVYVLNKDEKNQAFMLFPMDNLELTNPLQPDRVQQLPGRSGAKDILWQVTSPGEREHFLVFASAERLSKLENDFRSLPQARAGQPVVTSFPKSLIGRLRAARRRSVGGVLRHDAPVGRRHGEGDRSVDPADLAGESAQVTTTITPATRPRGASPRSCGSTRRPA